MSGDGDGVQPLAGVRVVELATWMASPAAGAMLADLGATVVKVEPLSGDPMRNMSRPARPDDGRPACDVSFLMDNRGKRSIAVAVDTEEGADIVRQLVANADIFVTNLLPRRQVRYGLDPETLFRTQPRLVHASMSGYGSTGPDADRPGFDVTAFFGRSGLLDTTMNEDDDDPPPPATAQGDHTAALALFAGVLAAMRVVDRTGVGQTIDVSLMATAAWTLGTDLAPVLVDGKAPTRRGRFNRLSPLANRFRCADGRWMITNMPELKWWAPFCTTIGLPELIDDPRFASARSRYDNGRALTELIDAAMATRTLAEWADAFDANGLVWGPVATLPEFAADAQATAVGLFPETVHGGHRYRTIGVPFSLAGADIGPRGAAPDVGEHTSSELRALGYDDAAITAMLEHRTVGGR